MGRSGSVWRLGFKWGIWIFRKLIQIESDISNLDELPSRIPHPDTLRDGTSAKTQCLTNTPAARRTCPRE